MVVSLSVKSDTKQVGKMFKNLQTSDTPKAARLALNRAAKQMHTATVREVAKEIKAPVKAVKSKVRHQKRDKAKGRKLRAGMYVVFSDLPARKFGTAKENKRGVRVRGRQFDDAFLGRFQHNKVEAVFRRKGKKRLPIVEVKVPIRQAVERAAKNKLLTVGRPVFRKRYEYELRRILKKRGYSA